MTMDKFWLLVPSPLQDKLVVASSLLGMAVTFICLGG